MTPVATLPEGFELPDLAGLIAERLEAPQRFLGETEEDVATRLGMPIVRQLTRPDSAPGGYKALRMSNLGKCARSLAYRLAGVAGKGRTIDARAKVTFAMGDTAESLVLAALADALSMGLGPEGARLGGLRQETGQGVAVLRHHLPGLRMPVEVVGHPDGFIVVPFSRACDDGTSYPTEVALLVEVKSTSSYGYDKAVEALRAGRSPWGPSETYWWQGQGYLRALGVPALGVVLLGKDSGAITSWWEVPDPHFDDLLSDHLTRVLFGGAPEHAPRMLGDGTLLEPAEQEVYRRSGTRKNGTTYTKGEPKGRSGKLPWQCTYCDHWQVCWGDEVESRVDKDWRGRPSRSLYYVGQRG